MIPRGKNKYNRAMKTLTGGVAQGKRSGARPRLSTTHISTSHISTTDIGTAHLSSSSLSNTNLSNTSLSNTNLNNGAALPPIVRRDTALNGSSS